MASTTQLLEGIYAQLEAINLKLGIEADNTFKSQAMAQTEAEKYWAPGGEGYAMRFGLPYNKPDSGNDRESAGEAENEDEEVEDYGTDTEEGDELPDGDEWEEGGSVGDGADTAGANTGVPSGSLPDAKAVTAAPPPRGRQNRRRGRQQTVGR